MSMQIVKPPLSTARVASCIGPVHLFVCLSVAKYKKNRFSQKLSNVELWCWRPIGSRTWAFKTHYWTPKIQDSLDPPSLKSTWRHFSAEGGPIWINFADWCRMTCGNMVKIKTRCRIPIWRTFGRIAWHVIPELPHCRVLPPGEFNVMIPELYVTLQGAATGRVQRHVIPEPRMTLQGVATWWIYCHDSRATCHVAGCSHLAKSMSWSCHIAGCNNSIRHIKNRFSPYFIFFVF